jgi:hypothetical protein
MSTSGGVEVLPPGVFLAVELTKFGSVGAIAKSSGRQIVRSEIVDRRKRHDNTADLDRRTRRERLLERQLDCEGEGVDPLRLCLDRERPGVARPPQPTVSW